MFAYCGNNPVNCSDPYGYFAGDLTANGGRGFSTGNMGAGYAGGGTVTNAEEIGTWILDNITEITAGTLTAIVCSSASASSNIEDSSVPQLAERTAPDGQYQYWEAFLIKKEVYLGKGLSITEASIRVSLGFNVMCANQDAARWLVVINGYVNAVGPEIHGDGYYWHYHPHRNTHTHIWFFGGPY